MMTPISLLSVLFSADAHATPDRVATVIDSGSTGISEIALSVDEEWVGLIEASGAVSFLNLATWEIQDDNASVCGTADPTAVAFYEDSSSQLFAFVGCSDSTIGIMSYATATGSWGIDTETTDDDATGTDTGDDGDTSGEGTTERFVDIAEGEIHAIHLLNETIYALAADSDGNSNALHSIDPDSLAVDSDGSFPILNITSAFTDAAVNENTNQINVLHSADNVSQLSVTSGAVTAPAVRLGGECEDIAVYNAFVLMACGDGGLYTLTNALNVQVALNDLENMDNVTATGSFESNTGLVVSDADNDTFLLYDLNGNSVVAGLTDSFAYDDADGDPNEMTSIDGYVMASTLGGQVMVLTDRPWVEITTDSGDFASVAVGDTLSLDFTSDTAGSWNLRIGGENGEIAASGEIEAGQTATASVELQDDDLSEGLNQFWIDVTDDQGREGHDAYESLVDNPPGQVQLTANDVGFGDGKIIVDIPAVDDDDLAGYDVYVSVNAFTRSEFSSGGPEFCTDEDGSTEDTAVDVGAIVCDELNEITTPIQVDASPGVDQTVTIDGVTNGTTYYVAVRAVDEGNLEGAMSAVHSVTPDEVFSAAELAGETGGFCGTSLAGSLMLSGLAGLMVAGRRRRRAAAVGLLALGGLAVPLDASAQAIGEPIDLVEQETERKWIERSGSIDFGTVSFDNDELQTVYGESGNLSIFLTQGVSLRHVLGLDFGTGFVRSRGVLTTADGTASAEEVRLTILPFSVSGTARLDLDTIDALEWWPVVVYGSVGLDYWVWRESYDEDFRLVSGDSLGGGKYGWHWAAGGQILLDNFEPDQASVLRSRTGIRDSYLTIEFRENNIGGSALENLGFGVRESNEQGLDFSGSTVIFGLRFDFL